ncbi:hypothetical protein ZWY2020_016396 [Hordeum vulgare]|nr:hypothetical protein ZWY2020_016396 [Hordeum vulgare]
MEEETPTTAGPGPGRKHDDGVDSEDPVSTGNGISSLQQPLLKRSNTLTANHLAMVGAKVSHIESLDYEIIENDLFKHDWRSRSTVEVLQYVFLKRALAFLVGLLTGVIASLINLAIENISGIKMLHMVQLVREKRYWAGFFYFRLQLGAHVRRRRALRRLRPHRRRPGHPRDQGIPQRRRHAQHVRRAAAHCQDHR